MQAWTLAPAGAPCAQAALAALAAVIEAVGRAGFAQQALRAVNGALQAGSWAVYRVWPDRPPAMHLSASQGVADTTASCFAIYRDSGLYRRDCSFEAARGRQARGSSVMLRMHADEAPSADHRDAIYLRHGMLERLSVARTDHDGSLLAVNLYRHQPQGRFSDGEVERFALLAEPLLAAVARHVDWAQQAPPAPQGSRQALLQRCAALTPRELDVLERLLQGMTYDGIAADMGLSLATVKTYRARAFERLDIHFKNELFALFVPEAAHPPATRLL